MKTAIGDVMRRCYDKGWITTRDGNISVRRSMDGKISKYMLITPTAVVKHHIYPDNVMKVDLEGEIPKGASIEFDMHYLLQKDAQKTRAVVHVHPTHVVAAMYAGFDLPTICEDFPEIFRYTKVGPTVPFAPPGSDDLAKNTNKAFRDSIMLANGNRMGSGSIIYDIVGQENHGVTAIGPNPWAAYEHIERLNHICEIVLTSGIKPKSRQEDR